MKKFFYLITAAAMMASFASCGKIDHGNAPTDGTTTLTIFAHTPQLKTYLSGGSTKWVKGDLITVFAEDGTSAKSDEVSDPQNDYNFKFKGWTTGKTPKYALAVGPQSYYDLYTVSYEDGLINATLRTAQVLYHKNSFSKLANIGVGEVVYAEGTGYTTYMKNLCGLIKFQVEGKNVEKVKISELDGKSLTGEVQIGMDENGNPKVQSVLNGRSYVEISATSSTNLNDNSGMLPHGADIYACVLPGEYRIKVESYAEGGELLNTLTLKDGSVMEVNRSEIATIGNENTTIKVDTFKPTTEGDEGEGEGEGEVEDIVLTLDFANQLFDPALPTSKTTEKKTYTLVDTDYVFTIYNNTHGFHYSSSGKYLRLIGDTGTKESPNPGYGYMHLPAIPGYRLLSTTVTGANTTGTKTYHICDIDPIENSITEENILSTVEISSVNTGTMTLSDSEAGVGYYFMLKGGLSDKNAQFSKLVLTYTYVEPTPVE